MKRFLLLFFFIPVLLGYSYTFAEIPRDGLRLELMLATGAVDTSGNGRLVTATGIAPTYQVDSMYGISHAQFSGSGGLKVNTAWTAAGTDDFTVSMWTKVDSSVFDNQFAGYFGINGGICLPSYPCKAYSPIRFPTSLFIAKNGEGDGQGLHLTVNNNGKCSIRSTQESGALFTANVSTLFGDIPFDFYQIYSNNGIFRSGMFTTMQDMFDCTVLKDSKWHTIIIRKQSGKIELLIDQKSIGRVTSAATLSRTISIGNLASFSMDQSIYDHLSQSIQNKVFKNHYFRGGMANIRLYSKAVSNDEILALNDEFNYTQSDLKGASGIQVTMDKYTKPNLSFYLKNVPLNLSKEAVIYQYSTSTGTFINIDSTNINSISSLTGSLSYQVNLDTSLISDGKVNLTLRVKNGEMYQNIGTIGFIKHDAIYTIDINQPDSTNSNSKTISATTSTGGVLYYYTTRSTTCDPINATWNEYTDLIFTSKSDNFIKICYKAVFVSTGKIIYKMSDPIQGITSTNQFNTTASLFSDYTGWTTGLYQKANDTASMVLELLSAVQKTSSFDNNNTPQGYSTTSGNNITLTDINGDGLVDFLYSLPNPARRAIIINNGNYTFKTIYKCAIDALNGVNIYYGDCVDTTR